MEDVNKRGRISFSLSKLGCGPQEINSWEIRLHLPFSANWNKRDKDWKLLSGPERATYVVATIIYCSSSPLFLAPRFWAPRDQPQQGFFLEARERTLGTRLLYPLVQWRQRYLQLGFFAYLALSRERVSRLQFHQGGRLVRTTWMSFWQANLN